MPRRRLTYRSEYVNVTLAGRTREGEPFAVALGKHGPSFPFFTPESEWDHVLVMVDGSGWAASARDLPALAITSGDSPSKPIADTQRGEATARIAFAGRARGASGASVDLAFEFRFAPVPFPAHHLVRPYDADAGPGMRWQPFFLATGEGDLALGSRRIGCRACCGELERGDLVGFRSPRLAFTYDYECLAFADPAATPASSYAYVHFVGHALRPRGAFGRGLERYLARSATAELTLTPDRAPAPAGDAHGVGPRSGADPRAVLATDAVDLGLATLERQIVRASDRSGRELYGLREIFTPK